jgi:para-nitrobenzyl esterase
MNHSINRRVFLGAGSVAASLLSRASAAEAMAETDAGKLRGTIENGVNVFKGVHYGASTAGANRFMPPMKVKPWTGVRDALKLGERSPQPPAGLIPEVAAVDRSEPMSEDCLCLNVWSKGLKDSQKRPVMVWLHGGGYSTGSGGFTIYDGANLARRHDVVVVTVNHRLNIFGFLYLADFGNPKFAHTSNLGMMDIVAALEWVRDNIANFGGDPQNVTVFGQSGGGGKVSTLMAMPAAKGLFHRAIVESASAIKGVPREEATKSAHAILAKLGVRENQLDELQKLPMEKLVAVVSGGGAAGNQSLHLAPVVDGHTLPRDPFYPNAPEISADVPLLTGRTATEITFIANTPLDNPDNATLKTRVMKAVHIDDAAAEKLIAAYRKAMPKASNRDLYLTLASDNWMSNVNVEAERKAALGKAPVYRYYFAWRSPVRDGLLGAFHTLEIPFVFENVDIGKSMTGDGKDRYPLEDKMSSAWVAFARTGKPETKLLPNWPAFDAGKRATMIFNDQCKVVDDPRRDLRLALAAAKAEQG